MVVLMVLSDETVDMGVMIQPKAGMDDAKPS
jgi:hypothetical protein